METVKRFVFAILLVYFLAPAKVMCAIENNGDQNVHAENEAEQDEASVHTSIQALNEALVEAAQKGDEQRVRELLAQNAQVDYKNAEGRTPLIIATIGGHAGVVGTLIEGGANVDIRDKDDFSALIYAALNDHAEIVKVLLAARASVDIQSKKGRTALMYAVDNNKIEAVKVLLSNNRIRRLIDIRDKGGSTALMLAAKNGKDGAIIRELVLAGAWVDIRSMCNEAFTPLMKAARGNHIDAVEALLSCGAQVNARTLDTSSTVLMRAVDGGHVRVVDALIAAGADVNIPNTAGMTPLIWAAYRGDIEVVCRLIAAGARTDVQSTGGYTALIVAAEQGFVPIINVLLNAGSRSDLALYKCGRTALMHAVGYNKLDVVKALLCDRGIKEHIDTRDKDGFTALMLAIEKSRDVAIIKELVKAGAHVDVRSAGSEGFTPLMKAAWRNKADAVDIVLHFGAQVNMQTQTTRRTALMLAIEKGYGNISNRLIKAGADVNIHDKNGVTALMIAVDLGNVDMVKSLIMAGADPNLASADGRTAFDRATPEMVQVMVEGYARMPLWQGGVVGIQKNIPDLPIMLALAVSQKNKLMVAWLLKVDPEAVAGAGVCSICMGFFAERVIGGGVELCRTNQACQHLVCAQCERQQQEVEAAPDNQRDRGIYLGQQNGRERWMLPGRVNLKRCPECRIEQGPAFVPHALQLEQFEQLKQEFNRWRQDRYQRMRSLCGWAAESEKSVEARREPAVELSVFYVHSAGAVVAESGADEERKEGVGVAVLVSDDEERKERVDVAVLPQQKDESKKQADKECRIL